MAITIIREVLTADPQQTVFVDNAQATAFGLTVDDYPKGTVIKFNPHLFKPVNIRGKCEEANPNSLYLSGPRTSLELLPVIPGTTKVIKVRRGTPISIT